MVTIKKEKTLQDLPPKIARYIVIDTQTTGFSLDNNNIIELAAIEICQGKLTGMQYHSFLKPRYQMEKRAQEKHKLNINFYNDYYEDCYQSDKIEMENFLKFIGNSIIFAHNATFDYNFINDELKYWNLPLINKSRFRCTMRMFISLFSLIDDHCKKNCSLNRCCEYFKLKCLKEEYHSALFDAFMTARLICAIYEFNDKLNNIENEEGIIQCFKEKKYSYNKKYLRKRNRTYNEEKEENRKCDIPINLYPQEKVCEDEFLLECEGIINDYMKKNEEDEYPNLMEFKDEELNEIINEYDSD